VGSLKKTSDKKRGNPNKRKRACQKRPSMKKEVTPTNANGFIKKDL
jgi:hypothetical protein